MVGDGGTEMMHVGVVGVVGVSALVGVGSIGKNCHVEKDVEEEVVVVEEGWPKMTYVSMGVGVCVLVGEGVEKRDVRGACLGGWRMMEKEKGVVGDEWVCV